MLQQCDGFRLSFHVGAKHSGGTCGRAHFVAAVVSGGAAVYIAVGCYARHASSLTVSRPISSWRML
jgi:hypothetical protein